jgi:hypothetical protein
MKLLAYIIAAFHISASWSVAGFVINPYRFVTSGSSFLLNQNSEGTGYDNGETWTEAGTGTVDEDHTGTVIAGSQSLRVNLSAQTGSTYASFTSQSSLFVKCRFRVASTSSNPTIITIRNGTTILASLILVGVNRTLRVNGGGSNGSASGTIATGTNIFVWFEYVKGTGSNAITRAGWAATDSKPDLSTTGAQTCIATNGTGTVNADRLYLGHSVSSTYEAFFDAVQVSATAF